MVALVTSRVLGVVRQMIFNAIFGTGMEADAFYAASHLPETLYNLIAGGALSHAFIPVFLSYEKEKGQYEAWRLTSLVFNVLLVGLVFVILLGELFAPAFVNHILVPGYSPTKQDMTIQLTRVMLIQPLIMGLGTIATAVLNSKRQFLMPALALAIYNVGLIGGLLVTLAFPSIGIYGPTYGTLVAALLQALVQMPALLKQGVRYIATLDLQHPGLREVLRLLVPNGLAVGIAYIAFIIDTAFSSYLPGSGNLSALHNALMVQGLPMALIAQAVGQALLPHLSVQAATGRYVRMYQTVVKVMGASILLTVPAALLLALCGKPLIHILFERGAFDPYSTQLTYLALLGYAISLPGYAAGELIARGFYALKDARTPLLTNIFTLILRVGLVVLLLRLLEGHYAIMSIPLALAGAATTEAVLLSVILLLRLRKAMRDDKGMQRLCRRRQAESTMNPSDVVRTFGSESM